LKVETFVRCTFQPETRKPDRSLQSGISNFERFLQFHESFPPVIFSREGFLLMVEATKKLSPGESIAAR